MAGVLMMKFVEKLIVIPIYLIMIAYGLFLSWGVSSVIEAEGGSFNYFSSWVFFVGMVWSTFWLLARPILIVFGKD